MVSKATHEGSHQYSHVGTQSERQASLAGCAVQEKSPLSHWSQSATEAPTNVDVDPDRGGAIGRPTRRTGRVQGYFPTSEQSHACQAEPHAPSNVHGTVR